MLWTGLWAILFLASIGTVAGSIRLLRAHSVAPPAEREGRASLSVVLAAHNEAPRIHEAIGSALAQDHPDFELLVVDDRSTDGTGEAAARAAGGDPRVRILRADARPPGWQGRLHAQALGVEAARGEWLFFLSADQRLTKPNILRAAIAECERREAKAISVLGRFVGDRWWERWWFHPMINNPIVWGTFLAVSQLQRSVWLVGALTMRRETYDAMGGVRAALDCGAGGYDDLGWSRAFTARGEPATLVTTPHLEDFSNWQSFADFYRGFTRWCVGIFTYRSGGWVGAGAFALLVIALYAAIGRSLVALSTQQSIEPAGLFALGFVLAVGTGHCLWNRRSLAWAPFFLVVGLEVLAIFAGAAWSGLRNRTIWRDDELRVRVPPPEEMPRAPDVRTCHSSTRS